MTLFPDAVRNETQARQILAVNSWDFNKTIDSMFKAHAKIQEVA
jgi:hypothetical protein